MAKAGNLGRMEVGFCKISMLALSYQRPSQATAAHFEAARLEQTSIIFFHHEGMNAVGWLG